MAGSFRCNLRFRVDLRQQLGRRPDRFWGRIVARVCHCSTLAHGYLEKILAVVTIRRLLFQIISRRGQTKSPDHIIQRPRAQGPRGRWIIPREVSHAAFLAYLVESLVGTVPGSPPGPPGRAAEGVAARSAGA